MGQVSVSLTYLLITICANPIQSSLPPPHDDFRLSQPYIDPPSPRTMLKRTITPVQTLPPLLIVCDGLPEVYNKWLQL